jgi:hypothetical protein
MKSKNDILIEIETNWYKTKDVWRHQCNEDTKSNIILYLCELSEEKLQSFYPKLWQYIRVIWWRSFNISSRTTNSESKYYKNKMTFATEELEDYFFNKIIDEEDELPIWKSFNLYDFINKYNILSQLEKDIFVAYYRLEDIDTFKYNWLYEKKITKKTIADKYNVSTYYITDKLNSAKYKITNVLRTIPEYKNLLNEENIEKLLKYYKKKNGII